MDQAIPKIKIIGQRSSTLDIYAFDARVTSFAILQVSRFATNPHRRLHAPPVLSIVLIIELHVIAPLSIKGPDSATISTVVLSSRARP